MFKPGDCKDRRCESDFSLLLHVSSVVIWIMSDVARLVGQGIAPHNPSMREIDVRPDALGLGLCYAGKVEICFWVSGTCTYPVREGQSMF